MNASASKANLETQKANQERQRQTSREGLLADVASSQASRFVDNRPEAIAQRKLQAMMNQSPQVQRQAQLQDKMNNSPRQVAQRRQWERMFGPAIQRQEGVDEELLQGKMEPVQRQEELEDDELLQGKFESVQRQALEDEELLQGKFATSETPTPFKGDPGPEENRTGLPDNLKAGIENLSGISMDDVNVHYNSSEPAQLQALAYTQGTDIHVGPGQERHLPHEAWHVVQQKQGRVKPTLQAKGVPINDAAALEHEADVMGAKALQMRRSEKSAFEFPIHSGAEVVQRAVILLEQRGEDAADDYALQKVLSGFDLANMEMLGNPWNSANVENGQQRTEYVILYADLPTFEKHGEKAREVKFEELVLEEDEDVYIVGHGGRGFVWTEPNHEGVVSDFGPMIKAIEAMAPDGWTGTVHVLTCNSAVDGTQKSVAEKLEKGLGRKDSATGTVGFAYGIGTAAQGSAQKMSVLKPEFDALYNADAEDEHTSKHLLKIARKDAAKSQELIGFDPKAGTFKSLSDAKLATLAWGYFVDRMKKIEADMKALVADADNKLGIRDEDDPIAKAQVLSQNDAWNKLAVAQQELFAHFELWVT